MTLNLIFEKKQQRLWEFLIGSEFLESKVFSFLLVAAAVSTGCGKQLGPQDPW